MKHKNILDSLKKEIGEIDNKVLKNVKSKKIDRDLDPIISSINTNEQKIKVTKKSKKGLAIVGISLVAVIAFTLVMLPLLFVAHNSDPIIETTVSLNINPSIDFMLDIDNEVVIAVPKNSDAEKLYGKQNFEGMSLQDALNNAAKIATLAGYIDLSYNANSVVNAIMVSAISSNQNTQDNVLNIAENAITNFFTKNQIYGVVLTGFYNKQELASMAEELNCLFEEQEFIDYENLSVTELHKIINDSHKRLRLMFNLDAGYNQFINYIVPYYRTHELNLAELKQDLADIESEISCFESVWNQRIESCKDLIKILQGEVAEIELKLSDINLSVEERAGLMVDLATVNKLLSDEELELAERINGEDNYNYSLEQLQNVKLGIGTKIQTLKNNYQDLLFELLEKFKAEDYDYYLTEEDKTALYVMQEEFNLHINNFQDQNNFVNSYENWMSTNSVKIDEIKQDFNFYKQAWKSSL